MYHRLMSSKLDNVVNEDAVEEHIQLHGEHFGGYYKVLTPAMRPGGGKLGMNRTRVPPGRAVCPFHHHVLEDEVFYILAGTGVLRYGDQLAPLRAGDCVSCPAGTKTAHQIANTGDEDLIYLAVGNYEPNEVCGYPDSDKVMVRSLGTVGTLDKTEYHHGEADPPKIFALAEGLNSDLDD